MTSAESRAVGAEIRAVLAKHPEVHLAILFGSVARGEERPESDVDLAVDRGLPLGPEEKMELISALAIATGRSVDLIDLHTIGEPLLGQVLKDGILLVGDRADYARLISKHVFEATDFLPYRQRIFEERRA